MWIYVNISGAVVETWAHARKHGFQNASREPESIGQRRHNILCPNVMVADVVRLTLAWVGGCRRRRWVEHTWQWSKISEECSTMNCCKRPLAYLSSSQP